MPHFALILRNKLQGIATLEDACSDLPESFSEDLKSRGYFVAPSYSYPDVFPVNYFVVNGVRYKSLGRAVEDNTAIDTIKVYVDNCGDKRSYDVPVKMIESVRIAHIEFLQEKHAKLQSEADSLKRHITALETHLGNDNR